MIFISRKVDYAILLLVHLARHKESSARELSDLYKLSKAFIANILKQLCQTGFIESQRGVRGGYRLAKPAAEITLDKLICGLEGPFQLMSCADTDSHEACEIGEVCPVRSPLRLVHQKLLETLREVTIEDLCAQEQQPQMLVTLNY